MLFAKRARVIHLVAVFLSTGLVTSAGAALAQAGDDTWRDHVGVWVESTEPMAGTSEQLVRLPAVADHTLPTSIMTKLFLHERGSFFGEAAARVVIGADDGLTHCQTKKVTVRRWVGKTQQPKATLAIDVCPQLRTSAHFRHAVDVNGQAVASTAEVSVQFSHVQRALVPIIPPVAPPRSRTSGHVLSDTGQWIDGPHWASLPDPFVIVPPNWSAALADVHGVPEGARVGVKLKLTAKYGSGLIESCKIALSSGDADLDAATCKAFLSTSYTEGRGPTYNQTYGDFDAYPVLLEWHGNNPEMIAPALPIVPHMPNDVPLAATDRPAGAPPALQAIPMEIVVDTNGHATGCKVMRSSGDDVWDAAGCRIALQRAHFTAPGDGFGRRAKGLYEAVADWAVMTIRPAQE